MRSIIVGTDFSEGSYVALEYAVDIANEMKCSIKLLWVRKEKKLVSAEHMDEAARLAEDKLQQLCDKHNPSLTSGTMSWEIKTGKVANVIGEVARKLDAPMVVIGTNGASGFEKYWMGSTAVRIVQEAPCPTLTIREGFDLHRGMKNIVVPIRENINSRQKVKPAIEMARTFHSTIHILGLWQVEDEAHSVNTYINQVGRLLVEEGIDYTCRVRHYENYAETLLKYADEVKGDLVVINTEQDRVISRLFLGTNAQQIVHNSQIPVLCIHPEDIGSIAR
ncbi:MAG: universal stress protein [Bacteroidales bacterium]|nr:universal stress protein [Bacteroidales bacterium]